MKVLIAAGGTGGHIYPGIAVATEIMARDPESEVLFVGTARGLEKNIVPDNGFQLSLINSSGLKNVGLIGKFKGLSVLPRSFLEARRIMRQFRPHVVVGAGGYVSGPVLMMAAIMGYPTLVMDSNALPGFTNRQLARFVDRAALTFNEAIPFFGTKAVMTGNPVRKDFFSIKEITNDGFIDLLIFGGSQGARAINDAMTAALPSINVYRDRVRIVHQTGEADSDKVKELYADAGWANAEVRAYISDMVAEFEKADLIICRAGATTCAELAAAGRPAIMIPLPTAADNHQRKNAEAMQNAGAATMIQQSESNGAALGNAIGNLISEPETLARMSKAAKGLGSADAAEKTVDIIEELKRNV
jgi:UDP-N-acetylglucosamine--N-acetylmuramyl-(pentapeptide) pyrophosphoryl-undecaprenol N-acetylglucosamine transferase